MELEKIDTSTTEGKARVMQLAAEGRTLVARQQNTTGRWFGDQYPVWNWMNVDYAILAQPVGPDAVWCLVTEDGMLVDGIAYECPADSVGVLRAVRYIRADLAEKSK